MGERKRRFSVQNVFQAPPPPLPPRRNSVAGHPQQQPHLKQEAGGRAENEYEVPEDTLFHEMALYEETVRSSSPDYVPLEQQSRQNEAVYSIPARSLVGISGHVSAAAKAVSTRRRSATVRGGRPTATPMTTTGPFTISLRNPILMKLGRLNGDRTYVAVIKVNPGGSARASGKVSIGMRIVAINGIQLLPETTVGEACRMIKASQGAACSVSFEAALPVDGPAGGGGLLPPPVSNRPRPGSIRRRPLPAPPSSLAESPASGVGGNAKSWTVQQTVRWLESNELADFAKKFAFHRFGGEQLVLLDWSSVKLLGVTTSARQTKLLDRIATLLRTVPQQQTTSTCKTMCETKTTPKHRRRHTTVRKSRRALPETPRARTLDAVVGSTDTDSAVENDAGAVAVAGAEEGPVYDMRTMLERKTETGKQHRYPSRDHRASDYDEEAALAEATRASTVDASLSPPPPRSPRAAAAATTAAAAVAPSSEVVSAQLQKCEHASRTEFSQYSEILFEVPGKARLLTEAEALKLAIDRSARSALKEAAHRDGGGFPRGTDAAAANSGLKAGMRIKMANAFDTREQRGECRREFGNAQQVRSAVNDMSPETAAIFIAPMDSGGYDKLNIMHTEPCEIPPFARGKLMNRYFDILPNPATMVPLQLQAVDGKPDPASTYINANFVRSYGGRRATEYIASQGPLPATVEAFMRMIWEQKMVVLVQTTGFVEKGTPKCERCVCVEVNRWPTNMNPNALNADAPPPRFPFPRSDWMAVLISGCVCADMPGGRGPQY